MALLAQRPALSASEEACAVVRNQTTRLAACVAAYQRMVLAATQRGGGRQALAAALGQTDAEALLAAWAALKAFQQAVGASGPELPK
ncbi:MAG: hypothetical protein FJ288_16370 [Planctomycetes bacterium]|nr:hypothetical protein [Planctomycetota bacterium]